MDTFTTSVTQKGQITLPKKFRDFLGLNAYDKVEVKLKKEKIEVNPLPDLLDIAGTIKPVSNPNKSAEEARKEFEKEYKRA